MIQEVFRLNEYFQKDFRMSYFRTKHDREIDLILSRGRKSVLVEFKSSAYVDEVEVLSLSRLAKDFPNSSVYFVSLDKTERKIEGVECCHWKSFLKNFERL